MELYSTWRALFGDLKSENWRDVHFSKIRGRNSLCANGLWRNIHFSSFWQIRDFPLSKRNILKQIAFSERGSILHSSINHHFSLSNLSPEFSFHLLLHWILVSEFRSHLPELFSCPLGFDGSLTVLSLVTGLEKNLMVCAGESMNPITRIPCGSNRKRRTIRVAPFSENGHLMFTSSLSRWKNAVTHVNTIDDQLNSA
jgi:hypothetical protein